MFVWTDKRLHFNCLCSDRVNSTDKHLHFIFQILKHEAYIIIHNYITSWDTFAYNIFPLQSYKIQSFNIFKKKIKNFNEVLPLEEEKNKLD